jgi:hypothetical protein
MTLATKLPPDDVGATPRHSDGVRGRRYTEIFLIDADATSGRLIAAVYNTSGLNDPAGTGDSSPSSSSIASTSRPSRTSTASSARSGTGRGCGRWTGWRGCPARSATSTG